MALLSTKSLAGPGYVILNCLRALNITGLLAVVVASIVMLVKIVIDSQFFFFDAVSHVITAFVSIFLIVSELSLFRTYFARHWPLLSPTHGFVTLGLAMEVLGVNILGNLNKEATSRKALGLGFWRIVIASGVLIIIFGFFNIVASYVFRDRDLGISARQVRAKGTMAIAEQAQQIAASQKSYTLSPSGSQRSAHEKGVTIQTPMTYAQPRTPENNNDRSQRRFPNLGRRPTLPSYHTSPVPSSKYSPREATQVRGMDISAPIGINPQFAHLQVVRPDSAYHPSRG